MPYYDPKIHRRRSIRLKGYDYARPGAYFVTICTYQRHNIFGEIVEGKMILNAFGKIVLQAWHDLPNHYPHVALDAFCIMPNHIHAIIVLLELAGNSELRKRHAMPEVVRALKSFSSRRINEQRGTPGLPVWQRNYYEHIVRSENSLDAIRRYIQYNPLKWDQDRDNPANRPPPQ